MRFKQDISNYRDLILFMNCSRISNLKILNLISLNLLDHLLYPSFESLSKASFFRDVEKQRLLDKLRNLDMDSYKLSLQKKGINFITILDFTYPENLRKIYNPPSLLYYKGDLNMLKNNLAFVGTRKITDYGNAACRKIIRDLRNTGVSIVSGMALGVDYYCHKYAIEEGLNTVGVLASSLDIYYPKKNLGLYKKMEDYLLLSEFPLNTAPIKRNFIMRNRIISGLSLATVVIEADEKSGSLVTANYAIDQYRDVFAVPGPIDSIYSRGTNKLIKNGAKPVLSGFDIIDELGFIREVQTLDGGENKGDLSVDEEKILEIVTESEKTFNQILIESTYSIPKLYKTLMDLELRELIKNTSNGKYRLS